MRSARLRSGISKYRGTSMPQTGISQDKTSDWWSEYSPRPHHRHRGRRASESRKHCLASEGVCLNSTFLGIGLLFTVAATIATYVPARRALRVDAMTALRNE